MVVSLCSVLRAVFRCALPCGCVGIRRCMAQWTAGTAGTEGTAWTCHRLTHRAVLHIQGQDTHSYLQGLLTNDIRTLQQEDQEEERRDTGIYTHLLNVQGRTLYDVIAYSSKENSDGTNSVLLECDSSMLNSITRHLKMYTIRRKVKVEACPDLLLWALLGVNTHCTHTAEEPELRNRDRVVLMARDPRTSLMGWRLITRSQENPPEIITACSHGNTDEYQHHRYKTGVPEGVQDLPPGEALPLESNLVFLNGISFSKGCYIGQELTARTHHTGVVRKRLMPLRLSVPVKNLQLGAPLSRLRAKWRETEVRGRGARAGPRTLELRQRDAHGVVHSGDKVSLVASVPDWWPQDMKDKL